MQRGTINAQLKSGLKTSKGRPRSSCPRSISSSKSAWTHSITGQCCQPLKLLDTKARQGIPHNNSYTWTTERNGLSGTWTNLLEVADNEFYETTHPSNQISTRRSYVQIVCLSNDYLIYEVTPGFKWKSITRSLLQLDVHSS